ncbi:hypothetical protein PanWU01x14_127970 [Parasponia andersonii]|uniref:Uncharacterized protein n=1 Tax=Parasponia andersonii TaxID=3476 RepID=A0A2P5CSL0_PARAD|nr:hypothetical protein PanWU01x14_127970 [Parasponia andersonii]
MQEPKQNEKLDYFPFEVENSNPELQDDVASDENDLFFQDNDAAGGQVQLDTDGNNNQGGGSGRNLHRGGGSRQAEVSQQVDNQSGRQITDEPDTNIEEISDYILSRDRV